MSDAPRYLVAKYISDLQRMEPRNIGVIVCTREGTQARFAAEHSDNPGEIDGRSIPPFVTSMAAYKQWVEYWRAELASKPKSAGRVLQRWFNELTHTSRGNFQLADGGTVLANVNADDLGQLTDHLFRTLVEPPQAEEVRDLFLDQVADDVIKRLRLSQNTHFHSRYRVDCEIAPDVTEAFEFSHAYQNGKLKRLYQRVPLASKRIPLRRVIHDSAWMFEKVISQGIIPREQAIALVYATPEHRRDPAVSWSFGVLNSVARVANLADPNEAISAFAVE